MSTIFKWEDEPDLDRLQKACALRQSDPECALKEFKEMAEEGSSNSMIYIGEMLNVAKGVSADGEQARFWFERAWKVGNISGALHLGGLYLSQNKYKMAEEVFRSGANSGSLSALYWLSQIYLNESSELFDERKGICLLEQAASLGNIFAKRELSSILIRKGAGMFRRMRGIFIRFTIFFSVLKIALKDPQSQKLRKNGIY